MEKDYEIDESRVDDYLMDADWPWPLALAYVLEKDHPGAIRRVLWAFETYIGRDNCCHAVAYSLLQTAKAGDLETLDWNVIRDIERPLLDAVKKGRVGTSGRETQNGRLVSLDQSLWSGSEIVPNETSELRKSGGRERAVLQSAPDQTNYPIFVYDVHVSASELRAEFGECRIEYCFLPAPNAGELRQLSEMFNLASMGTIAADTNLFENEAGEIMVVPPLGVETEEQWQQHVAGNLRAFVKALSGLRDGELHAYVFLEPTAYKIPREYWFQNGDLIRIASDSQLVPRRFRRAPIVADMRDLVRWRDFLRDDALSLPSSRGMRADLIPSGMPGRPTGKKIMLEFFNKRIVAGEVSSVGLSDEARILKQMYDQATDSSAPSLTQSTIENAIRQEYWKYRKENKSI